MEKINLNFVVYRPDRDVYITFSCKPLGEWDRFDLADLPEELEQNLRSIVETTPLEELSSTGVIDEIIDIYNDIDDFDSDGGWVLGHFRCDLCLEQQSFLGC